MECNHKQLDKFHDRIEKIGNEAFNKEVDDFMKKEQNYDHLAYHMGVGLFEALKDFGVLKFDKNIKEEAVKQTMEMLIGSAIYVALEIDGYKENADFPRREFVSNIPASRKEAKDIMKFVDDILKQKDDCEKGFFIVCKKAGNGWETTTLAAGTESKKILELIDSIVEHIKETPDDHEE